MIDPLTALSIASTAVGQMRQLLNAGRDTSQALSKFAGAWSDISYAESKAKNPPWYKSFSGSAEKEALEIFTAKKKMMEMKKEVETMISFVHGPSGLEEYKDTIRKVREQRRKHQYKKAEIKQSIIDFILISVMLLGIIAILGGGIYFYGVYKGTW
ncbi:hypothetical protein N9765_01470 [Candidatus Pelagibacter sp.]|nr:hypothetical protein [Candidatus Pelagibacter sp.]